VLISSEDVAIGKPDPDIYRYTLDQLNAKRRLAEPPCRPQECVVVEDSIAGIAAGLAADMKKVVSVAQTYLKPY
jgi:HAD superfamily hydrolase (TIGR01509 family)